MEFVTSGYNWRHGKNFVGHSILPLLEKTRILVMLVRTKCSVKFENNKEQFYDKDIIIVGEFGTSFVVTSHDDIFINDWFEFYCEKNELMEKYDLQTNKVYTGFSASEILEFSKLVFDITYENHNQYEKYNNFINTYLDCFFCKLYRCFNKSSVNNQHPHFDDFEKLRYSFLSNPKENNSMKEIAKRMYLSESYIRNTYKQLFGVSIHKDIINSKIDYAKKAINTNPALSLHSLAEDCGFKCYEHFSRQFKKNTGLSPSKYRAKAEQDKEVYL